MNDNRKSWTDAQSDMIDYHNALNNSSYKFVLYIESTITCVAVLFFVSIFLFIGYVLDINTTPSIIGYLIAVTASNIYSATKAYRQSEKTINRNFNKGKAAYTNRD